ncbi:hypothetical protein MHTCC0001_25770 [Flavobacteriaceae bacterium MHTCC 0001]
MDGLDLLKKDWDKETSESKLSIQDIYPMIHKKSSSIVKTLFYISIAELIFWITINVIPYFFSQSYKERLEQLYSNDTLYIGITIFGFLIIILFIYLLYKSYKSISVTDSARKLMENILKTRKIIKYYVLYNLVVAGLSIVYGIYDVLNNDPNISSKISDFNNGQIAFAIAITVVFTAVFIALIWLFYLLIYGLLLKRLNRNYKELKSIEALS